MTAATWGPVLVTGSDSGRVGQTPRRSHPQPTLDAFGQGWALRRCPY
jgi:hypothetical protein